MDYKKEDVILNDGVISKDMFLIMKGSVRVEKGKKGPELVLLPGCLDDLIRNVEARLGCSSTLLESRPTAERKGMQPAGMGQSAKPKLSTPE